MKQSTDELPIEVGTAQTQHRIGGSRIPASTRDLEASPNLLTADSTAPEPMEQSCSAW